MVGDCKNRDLAKKNNFHTHTFTHAHWGIANIVTVAAPISQHRHTKTHSLACWSGCVWVDLSDFCRDQTQSGMKVFLSSAWHCASASIFMNYFSQLMTNTKWHLLSDMAHWKPISDQLLEILAIGHDNELLWSTICTQYVFKCCLPMVKFINLSFASLYIHKT